MAYKTGNRMQSNLLPHCMDDYITADDPVRVYDAFVDALDFIQLGIDMESVKEGADTYWPKDMVKLLVYGYSYGHRSSRKLERACHHNLSFIWLMGGLTPDYRTIARFRDTHKEALRNILKQSVRMCLKLNLIDGHSLFVDSTIIKANASLSKTWDPQRCQKALAAIDREIDQLMDEVQTIDQSEESQKSLSELKQKLSQTQQLKKKVESITSELQKRQIRNSSKAKTFYNTTDPECLKIHKGHKTQAGYNVQAVVDGKNGLIVHAESTTVHNDYSQLSSQITQAQEVLGHSPTQVSADSGYYSLVDFEKIAETITIVVPSPQDVSKERSSSKQRFSKDEFIYDTQSDTYICPAGKKLPFHSRHRKYRSSFYKAHPEDCQSCIHWGVCTSSVHGRTVGRLFEEERKIELKNIYESPSGQKIYQRRKEVCELPFGHIKQNCYAQQFLLRGQSSTQAEVGILSTCFNLTRMINLVGALNLKEHLKNLKINPNIN